MHPQFGVSIRIRLTRIFGNAQYLFYLKEGTITKEFCENMNKLMNKILENPKLYTNKNLLNASGDTLPKSRIIFTKNSQKNWENYDKILIYFMDFMRI